MSTTMTIDQIFLTLLEKTSCTHKQKTKRNRSIFHGFYGLSGGPGTTLEEQGKLHGRITREAVRLTIESMQVQFFLRKEEKAVVARALAILNSCAPCDISVAAERMQSEGVLSEGIDNPKGIMDLGAALMKEGMGVRFKNVNGRYFVIGTEGDDPIKRIRGEASKAIRTFGMVSIEGIQARLKNIGVNVDDALIVSFLDAHEEFLFVNDDRLWVTSSDIENTSLGRRLQTVFSLYRSVCLDDLYRACARSIRMVKLNSHKGTPEHRVFYVPSVKEINDQREKEGLGPVRRRPSVSEGRMKMAFPVSVFRDYLDLFPWLSVFKMEADRYEVARVGEIEKPDRDGIEIERRIVDAIYQSGRKQLNDHQIREAANISESECYTYMMVCNRSPVITRVQRGKYKLIGMPSDI